MALLRPVGPAVATVVASGWLDRESVLGWLDTGSVVGGLDTGSVVGGLDTGSVVGWGVTAGPVGAVVSVDEDPPVSAVVPGDVECVLALARVVALVVLFFFAFVFAFVVAFVFAFVVPVVEIFVAPVPRPFAPLPEGVPCARVAPPYAFPFAGPPLSLLPCEAVESTSPPGTCPRPVACGFVFGVVRPVALPFLTATATPFVAPFASAP